MRYAFLVAVAAAAVWGANNLGASNSNAMLVDAGLGVPAAELSMWVVGMIAGLMVLSLCRVVAFSTPSMMESWMRTNQSWLVPGGAGGLMYGMLYLM